MTDHNDLADLKLALGLLVGSLSPKDSKAHSAIARLLRNLREPVDSAIRLRLADLLDPETDTNRKIRFVDRRGRRDEGRTLQIADAVADLRFRDDEEGTSMSRDDAIEQVAEDFNVSRRRVEAAMEAYKTWFDRIEQSWEVGYLEIKRLRKEARERRRKPVISLKRRTERK